MEEDTNFNSTNSETKDNSSDLSRPPGFEFMKKSFSSSSNCSTSFARRRKNDIKRISLIKNVRITALDRLWSDHNPILLHIDKTDFGPTPFKLYNSWLLRDDHNNGATNFKTLERNRKTVALEEMNQLRKGLLRDRYAFDIDHRLIFFKESGKDHAVILLTDWNAKEMDNLIVDVPFHLPWSPHGSNMKSIASWKTLVDCFHMRLSSWKANLLSIGGRLTLIKSVLGSLGLTKISFPLLLILLLGINLSPGRSMCLCGGFPWTDYSLRCIPVLRGMDIPAISCPSCNANVESANHVFFECDIATDMWKLVFRWCDIPLFQASSWDSFNDWIISWHASKEKKHRFYVITTSVLWWLWRYRNSVTFNSQPLRKSDLFDNVRFSSFSWLTIGTIEVILDDWLMYPLSIFAYGNG
ncbi:hypothetical protein Tco_0701232 [Tanacetum coccineum]